LNASTSFAFMLPSASDYIATKSRREWGRR
jgi:hypothetical protein